MKRQNTDRADGNIYNGGGNDVNTDRADALSLVNDTVRALKAYHLAPEEYDVKLNQNENPHDWPQNIKKKVADFFVARPWNRYPNFIPVDLKAALAKHVGNSIVNNNNRNDRDDCNDSNGKKNITADNVIVGNGSNEMLLILLLSFAAKAKTAIVCSPTFTVYKLLCDGMGVKTVTVSLDDNLQYDTRAIKNAVANNPNALLILCSPNNPVGNSISAEDFREIMNAHTGVCILDQAYVEFGGFDGTAFLREYKNLIVTRTFSKAMSGAGLRLGYMIGDADLIAEVNKIKLPYNINFFTEHAAMVMLENAFVVDETVAEIISERDKLYNFLKTLPLDNVYPSDANFILIRSSKKQKLFDRLKENGILVRDVSNYPMLENCLRISVGTKEENLRLMKTLDEID